MFEIAEYTVLANQINHVLRGKTVRTGNLGNSPYKFVWHNCKTKNSQPRSPARWSGNLLFGDGGSSSRLNPASSYFLANVAGKCSTTNQG